MGYISNVKSIIAFESVKDRDQFIGKHPEEIDLVKEGFNARIVDEPYPAIVLDLSWVKWYGKEIRNMFPDMGFDPVIAWENLMDAAEGDNRVGEMPISGVFVRIGEELDDIQFDRWMALDGDGEELLEPDVFLEIGVSVISTWMDPRWEAPSK